ncbi:hypothetical protein GCG54_00002501 [Colletotrichum gloeosporioides]|uniref:Heterokaryon incompatibility domain-containing protein n=1 Tax=Colletotrichum gloeosporioides TaxID=474922 RepID=A0A8H4FPY6_COLGL|nr:uncharacterized protein GCG54_00002501 [Colletotrichum gloeosporioides]KAF3810051.1 hypothetical protein GCG54_00002501 [Colletotrichum gloeosporioides]
MTKLLGLRYLWVDQLCIIQDEESTAKHEEISNMDHIYACATVTLVAAATSGLFEEIFKGRVSSKDDTLEGPLATTQASVNLRELDQKAILNHYTSISKSMWAKRGWTYQEAILSKRVIFFYDDAVFWQCGCAVWDMDHLTPDEDNPIAATNMAKQTLTRRFLTPSNPDFGLYMDLICPFNGRNFTHEEDGLMACTGILNRLAPAFRGGFLGGLPIEFLDYALLWQPLKYCHRRTSSSTNKPCFPSWAWCGWQCLVDPWSFQSSFCLDGNDAVRKAKAGSWKLKNLINWQTKIISQEHSSIDSALPPSCAQEDFFSVRKSSISSPNIEIHDDFHSNTKAIHSSAGDRKSPGDQLILLECDTEIAVFIPAATLGIHESLTRHRAVKHVLWDPTMNEKPLHHLSKVVVLQDRDGVFAGLVRVTENLDYKRLERTTRRFPEGITTKCGKGFEMDLIAISEGRATRGDMKMCFEEKVLRRSPYYDHAPFETEYDGDGWWTGSSATDWWGQGHVVLPAGNWNENLTLPKEDACDEEIVDFYNVLWVQKGDDQISRRLGCGRVLTDRWRKNQPRIVRVTLG